MVATGNREDALDIVQDAMLRLARRYGDRDTAEWVPLFQRILQSVIRDWYRRTQVRNRWRQFLGRRDTASDAGADEREDPIEARVAGVEPEPGTQLAHQQAIEALEAALHRLPLRQQQAFLLRQWEGLSVSETAAAMGCGEGSVKTHCSRALQALRGSLADSWLGAKE
jgi:RNA polymerase sigma-70 factor (ECF subfamily)